MFAIGLAAALFASALFNVGVALQGLEARREPRRLGLRLSLLSRLLRRPLWLLGFALGVIGVGPQVLALSDAPFVVVQPALVVGLLILLAIGTTYFHEPVGRLEVAGVLAIIGGVALDAWGAAPHVEAHRSWLPVLATVAALTIPSLLPFVFRAGNWLILLGAGCAWAVTNISTKLGSDDLGANHWWNAFTWGIVALVFGVVATLTTMTAFQRSRATVVVPVTTMVQTYLPLLLEPAFLRERYDAADIAPLSGGILLAAVGTLL